MTLNLRFLLHLVLPPITTLNLWFHFILMPITTLNFCYVEAELSLNWERRSTQEGAKSLVWDILTQMPPPPTQYQGARVSARGSAASCTTSLQPRVKKNGWRRERKKSFSFSHYVFVPWIISTQAPDSRRLGGAHDVSETWPRKQKIANFNVNYTHFKMLTKMEHLTVIRCSWSLTLTTKPSLRDIYR